MVSARLPEWAVLAVTAFTTEVPHQVRHGGPRFGPVADLAWNHADDPLVCTNRRSVELWPVVDYERVSLKHGSPFVACEEPLRTCFDSAMCCAFWDCLGLK